MATDTPLVPDDRAAKKQTDDPGKDNASLDSSDSTDQIDTSVGNDTEADESTGGLGQGASSDSAGGVNLREPASRTSLAAGRGIAVLSKGAGRFAAKNKRGLAVGGGVGAILAIVFFSLLALLPLKLEHMIKNIVEHRFQRMEFALEKRAEKHVESYLEKQVRAKAESKGGSPVIATGNLASDLYQNWQANKFEDKLSADLGVKMDWDKKTNTYTITQAIGGKEELFKGQNLEHIGNNEFRSKLNEVVKKETKWNQVYKRHHTRKILSLKFGVKKYWVFPKTRESLAGKAYNAKQYLKHELVVRIVEPVSAKYATYFHCIIDGCGEDELRQALGEDAVSPGSGGTENDAAFHDPGAKDAKQAQADEADANSHIDNATSSNLAEATTNEVEHNIENATAEEADKLFGEEIIKQLQSELGKKILASIGTGIGLLTFISKLNAAIQHHTFSRIVASKNSLQYANEFATFATISDQIKEGQVTGEEVSAVMDQVGDYASSKSYERSSGIDPTGQRVYCSGNPSDPKNTDFTLEDVCPDKKVGNNGASDIEATIANSPLFKPIQIIADAWDNSAGGVYDAVSGILGGAIDAVLGPIMDTVLGLLKSIGIDINQWLQDGFFKVLGFFFGPVISGNETGAGLYNAVDAGADVTANAEMQSAGGHKLPAGVASELDPLILQQQIADAKKQTLWNRLTSLDNDNSVASNLLVAFVMTPKQMVASASTAFASLAMAPLRVFANNAPRFALATTSPAYAALTEASDPYAIQQIDFSTTTLDADPDTVQRLDGKGPCPPDENDPYYQTRSSETVDDPCRLELLTVQSLNSVYTTQDDGALVHSQTTQAASPSGNTVDLAKQLLASPNVSFTTQLANDAMTAAAAGQPSQIEPRCQHGEVAQANLTSATLDPKLLSFLLQAATKYQIGIGYLTNGCHEGSNPGDTSVSAHFYGRAVDLNTVNGQPVSGGEQLSWEFLNGVMAFLPSGSGIGQSQCGVSAHVQAGPGIRLFNDSCNHIHVQVSQ